MVSQNVLITNPSGLHARPASQFVKYIKQFKSRVFIVTKDTEADCGSIINLLTLAIKPGTTVEVKAIGEDEQDALAKVVEFLKNLKE